jgi:4-hydroxy-tetrahydrodipicolinate synthase
MGLWSLSYSTRGPFRVLAHRKAREMHFEGVYSVLPTPFCADGSLDLGSLRTMTDLYLRAGIQGVTALGATSEVTKLTERERANVLERIMDQVNGRVPVIVGATAQGLLPCIEFTKRAQSNGAHAVMVSPPRMATPSSDKVFAHFAELAAAVDIQIVVQDYPPISGVTMEPTLLVRVAREIPHARTIKLEDPPTPTKIARIKEAYMGGEIRIFGGLGGLYLFEELLAGAAGVMTGFAYPEMLVEVVELFRADELGRAADVFYRYVPLIRFEFQQGIGTALRKEILRRRGAIADGFVRAPGGKADTVSLSALNTLLRWMRDKEGVRWISV